MNKQLLKDGLGWGFMLWLVGYILGIVFFMFIPKNLIGWTIMPIGIAMTLYILLKRIKKQPIDYYVKIAVIWTVIAIVCDYLFLVKVFKPEDGYYKLDVYIYYTVTFMLPLIVGWRRNNVKK